MVYGMLECILCFKLTMVEVVFGEGKRKPGITNDVRDRGTDHSDGDGGNDCCWACKNTENVHSCDTCIRRSAPAP